MTYERLLGLVQRYHLRTQMNVVSFLIGYQGCVTAQDFDYIMDLLENGFID